MRRWEYMKHRVDADTSVIELCGLGDNGWRLCGIVGGNMGIFCRDVIERKLAEQGNEQRGSASP